MVTSIPVIRRLCRYYRHLEVLIEQGIERIASRDFAVMLGQTASQIRQDLNYYGHFGQQGYGYHTVDLHRALGDILAVPQKFPTILIGAGNLGAALVNHIDFVHNGFELIGVFDCAPQLVGTCIQRHTVADMAGIRAFCLQHAPQAAILCVPDDEAEQVADLLVRLGVQAFWNFTHRDLRGLYCEDIVVENVHLNDSLMTLCHLLGNRMPPALQTG